MEWTGQHIYDLVSKFRNTVDFSRDVTFSAADFSGDVTFYQPTNSCYENYIRERLIKNWPERYNT